VKIPDANVLIYSVNPATEQHADARAFLSHALGGGEPIGFAWSAVLAFLRLTTRASIFPHPLSVTAAFDVVDAWLQQPAAVAVMPTARHAAVLRSLLQPLGTAGNLTSDAHIAALAIEHGATLVTYDTDFARFSGLRSMTPADARSR
jgi:hypothetical protein